MTKTENPLVIRKWYSFVEEILRNENSEPADGDPLLKLAVAACIKNPYAGRYCANLDQLIDPSAALGAELGERMLALAAGRTMDSYGKAIVVGAAGEYEHGNALLTNIGAGPVRDAVGGGKAWVPSTGKRGGLGTSIDIPLAHKNALYVRSHYDSMTVTFADSPMADEIVVVWAFANRGRLCARLGGLQASEIVGEDGLR